VGGSDAEPGDGGKAHKRTEATALRELGARNTRFAF
jgi:hypothetical protein